MEFENKKLRDVAEIARQIMMGEKVLHPNQQKLDVHEPEKDELTADDFKKLRAKKEEVKKEEVEDLDEKARFAQFTPGDQLAFRSLYAPGAPTKRGGTGAHEYGTKPRATTIAKKTQSLKDKIVGSAGKHGPTGKLPEEVEESEQIQEYTSVGGKYVHRQKEVKDAEAGVTDWDKEEKMAKKLTKTKKPVMKGARQNRNFNTKLYKEGFTELVSTYSENGLKGLFETLNQNKVIIEEPTSAEFDAEIKVAQDKSEGKGKKAEVAAAGIEAVKQEGVEVVEYPLDANEINGYSEVTISESVELTEDEAEMLASLSQEEFNYLTEEEQDLFIEYFQSLDEISTGATKKYLHKAIPSSSKLNQKAAKPGDAAARASNYSHENDTYETKQFQKFSKRRTGVRKAITKLASAHPANKKLATTARQAFNKLHNTNYRIGMGKGTEDPSDRKFVKQQHAVMHKAVNAMKEEVEPTQLMSFKARYKK